MTKTKIQELEFSNDEQTIHLFYDDSLGQYVAFGLSAYYTTLVADPHAVYTKDMDMPMVTLKEKEIQKLCHEMNVVEHEKNCYYRFQLKNKVGRRWYQTWMNSVKRGK